MRNGPFTLLRVIVHAEPEAVIWITADSPFNCSLILLDIAPDNCRVDAVYGVNEELIGQIELRSRVLCYHQKPACVLVYAVHQNSHPFILNVWAEVQVICKGVHKGAVIIPVPGVYHHPGGLIHHQDIIVLIRYVKRDVLRKYLRTPSLIGHYKLHNVTRAHNVVGLDGFVIDQHISQLYCLLDPVTGCVLLM